MSVEQHAEAAADAVFELYVGAEPFTTGAIKSVVWNHAQFAIDEATAPLRARVAELEGLGPLIEEYIAAVNRQVYLEDQSGEMFDLSLTIKQKLKGGAP